MSASTLFNLIQYTRLSPFIPMQRLAMLACLSLLLVFSQSLHATSVWKVEGPSSHFYLGGTLHILHPNEYPLPHAFDQAYQAAEIIVTEVNFDEINNPQTVFDQTRYLLYPPGQSLQAHLNSATWQRLQTNLKSYGAPATLINQMKPSLAATTLAMMAFNAAGITAPGVDDHFFRRAKQDKKILASLETLALQFKAIASFDHFDPNDVINSTLNEISDASSAFEKMASAWRSGETNILIDVFINPMKKEFPHAYAAILVDRNQQWMIKLKEYLQTPSIEFVLVGAAHMAGPDGLVSQLEAEGFKVMQINNPNHTTHSHTLTEHRVALEPSNLP